MRSFIIALITASGIALPVQAAINARLREAIGSPILGALISFLVGMAALLVLWAAGVTGRGHAPASATPWWYWVGGFCGALVVFSAILGVPRIGATGVVVFTIVGQLAASVVLDHFGWLGVPKFPANPTRIAGVLLVLVGAVLTMRKG
jgi:transporter family-2 protein